MSLSSEQPTLVVHHLNNSRSQRLLWLLEELEVPYTIKKYQRGEDMLAPKELKQIHPLGKSPVITDGDLTIAESGAIVEYIIGKYGRGRADPPEAGKLENLYWLHYAEGSLMPILVQKLIFGIIPSRSPFFIRPIVSGIFGQLTKMIVEPQLKTHCEFIEAHLSKSGDWFAGGDHPTAADYMMFFPLEGMMDRNVSYIGPKSKAYLQRVNERPAYKRGIEKGGEFHL
ncbi:thioredoxin-like protein [Punctularia strigosozonata HHB-11173 SS5]|uniref:thioredoxin-like protein n=1 Tax=Punctularia strigosozonata (strain HHB-11173) TaxID=741275 RepID=UPI0004418080|nr:thioredoxin-like protein [Punctularia strigosozonata HHB-11173 SS5]EIN08792.1 thioredoxin-like protein [Punctularia strigosozonata HHB-11173 SS5]